MGSGYKLLVLLSAFIVLTSSATPYKLGAKYNKGSKYIVKTFKTDAGEYVDCIDMYKQPALSHPLLVNHTIQVQPSNGAHTLKPKFDVPSPIKSGYRCPIGSIPIKRNHISARHFKKYSPPDQQQEANTHKYATMTGPATAGTVNGIYGTLNIWKPMVNDDNGLSLSQLWLAAGTGQNLNTMEVGWQVLPNLYHNNEPALFIYWTNNDYQRGDNSGCYNLNCPGFVQTSSDMIIGASLTPSTYGGQQYEIEVGIQKDTKSGNWWLYIEEKPIGYWPKSLFTTLADAGDTVQWGGEVTSISNQMGSGHLPDEGFSKSSYIRNIKYSDTQGNVINPNLQQLIPLTTNPTCYNLHVDDSKELYLFFGGPGCTE